jgi:hypothetical protein
MFLEEKGYTEGENVPSKTTRCFAAAWCDSTGFEEPPGFLKNANFLTPSFWSGTISCVNPKGQELRKNNLRRQARDRKGRSGGTVRLGVRNKLIPKEASGLLSIFASQMS